MKTGDDVPTGGEVTIQSALDQIESGVKKRATGLANLKHVLRHNQNSASLEALKDNAVHKIFEILFNVAISEQSTWLSSKAAVTRSAADTRLSDCASALRLSVEVGIQTVKIKTVRALLDHVMQTLHLPDGSLCLSLSLDYAKCLRIAVGHQPHVEHLPKQDWHRIASFCAKIVQDAGTDYDTDITMSGAEDSVSAGHGTSSYRSTHSNSREARGSQAARSLSKQVAEEMIASLSLLTLTPNAPIGDQASDLLWTLIGFLKTSSMNRASNKDAFAAINNVLHWTRSEDTSLTKSTISHLMRLIRRFWPDKPPGVKDEMLITLLLLQPYLEAGARSEANESLRSEIASLLGALRAEYSSRLERDQLHMDDLRLLASMPTRHDQIGTAICRLRSGRRTAEHNWALVHSLAMCCDLVMDEASAETTPDNEEGNVIGTGPRKRLRMTNELEETLHSAAGGPAATVASRLCALQTIVLLTQRKALSVDHISRCADHLTTSCNEDNGTISSWALLAVTGLATQTRSTEITLSSRWDSMWQLAVRTMSNATTCRAACHLLHVLLHLRLASQSGVAELLETVTHSMDLGGPAVVADSVLHLLVALIETSQQGNPRSATALAESSLSWFLRGFSPSRFDDRVYTGSQAHYSALDARLLVNACTNQWSDIHLTDPISTWESIAQAWISQKEQYPLVSYLLLQPERARTVNELLDQPTAMKGAVSASRAACETLLLNHSIAEMGRTAIAWKQWVHERPNNVSLDTFKSLCHACCILSSLAYDITFRDLRRQKQLQHQIDEVHQSLRRFAMGPSCGQDKIDSLLQSFSQALPGLFTSDDSPVPSFLQNETVVSKFIFETMQSRQKAKDFDSLDDDEDLMDMDGTYDSQESRRSRKATEIFDLKNDAATAFSLLTLRSDVTLYAAAVTMMSDENSQSAHEAESASAKITTYMLSLSETSLLASRASVSLLPKIGLLLHAADADRLLTFCADSILPSYTYERSEVAVGAILDIMSSLIPIWTARTNRSLYNLGVDMYDWYTTTALTGGVLSPNVQRRAASLLLQLCHVDTDYGQEDGERSVRTSLFKLLELGSVTVKYHLADRISTIFGLYVLAKHTDMFDDLCTSLPDDVEWIEGLAIRLLFFARLASAWHSLLRPCVYYIFETAGKLKSSMQYAAHCIGELASSLDFTNPQKLFRLFAPQLLHTWLESQTVASLPFAAFRYDTLNDLLQRNRGEITAQLLMQGNDEGMQFLATALGTTPKDLAKSSFAKCVAYTISWDVSQPGSKSESETRLRNLVNNKEEYLTMIAAQFPNIMGNIYLTTQQDDAHDKCLEKKKDYAVQAKALEEMKAYSYSARTLPPSQQPSFKSKYLCDQVERLCRRTQYDPLKPWDASSFALAARMILDSIDGALGPLHTCLMLRRLRLLICMAGDVAKSEFALEMLLQHVRPFLHDSECADDALGILQYLLHHGQQYLRSSNLVFVNGTVSVMILQMRHHATAKHDSTTQESQHMLTLHKMETFQKWLVDYLQQCYDGAGALLSASHGDLVRALRLVHLPGNARRNSAESALLLLLLEQQGHEESLFLSSHGTEALSLLTRRFEVPTSVSEDCLGEDQASVRYANHIWSSLQASDLSEDFLLWASGVLGRAYASTGIRPYTYHSTIAKGAQSAIKAYEGVPRSQATIAQHLLSLLFSQDRAQAGLADYTLRGIQQTFKDAEEAIAFEQMLPSTLISAVAGGTYEYKPDAAVNNMSVTITTELLQLALKPPGTTSDDDWQQNLAACLCQWASQIAVLPALPAVLRDVPGLAADLLPAIIHIVLAAEHSVQPTLRAELSNALAAYMAEQNPAMLSRQRFLLEVLLYLRSRPYPAEKTKADRLQWLEVDYLVAADAAARCALPTCALLLAESAAPTLQTGRRASSRVSMSQVSSEQVSDELLLLIFKQIEEPDSFYGVQQAANLDSVLSRLDYERDGFKSLMFRSAQMDNAMRTTHRSELLNSSGIARSLSALNLNSISYALLSGSNASSSESVQDVLETAKRLQQWDLTPPERSSSAAVDTFAFFQELSRAGDPARVREKLNSLLLNHIAGGKMSKLERPSLAWCNTLASLVESGDVLYASSDTELRASWSTLSARQEWMQMARFEDCYGIQSDRRTLFSILSQNKMLLGAMHIGRKACRLIEVEMLLQISRFTRGHSVLQEALSSTTQATALQAECSELGVSITAATALETASVLWSVGETTASVKMLREIVASPNIESQDIPVGRSGLMAQLGHQLADARLEKPDDILADYLKPAIKNLKGRNEGQEAGQVFHEFASFCERQLQNPGNVEDFNRMARIRQKKLDEVRGLEAIATSSKKVGAERQSINGSLNKARQWYNIDNAEYQRMRQSRDTYAELSLQNYLLTLSASDEHNICVLRFFALWLDNYEMASANQAISKHLPGVPSWKFVLLNNQLLSRLEDDQTAFQTALKALALRICAEHPHHSLHHLYASTRRPGNNDTAASSRYRAAANIRATLQSNSTTGDLVKRVFQANGYYNTMAQAEVDKQNTRLSLKDVPSALKMSEMVKGYKVPPATISIPIHADGNYSEVPIVTRFSNSISIMNGLSAPKALVAYASNGQQYKQLFKGGNDDLRQDAIMEQVFEEVSKMLRNHKATRQRNLHVRTYKVIPLTTRSGIIEFVPNSMPINDFLQPAHLRYYPGSLRSGAAREKISAVKDLAKESRVKEFRKVCASLPPVLRHFFLERFDDPDEWFEKRTNYTRTTATVSMLGHVLGLGDRHCHNILLDEKSGEVVHIDLGVAFEAGKILPIPEMVPFRLTRDIIDGMGITKTEGVFRRCCEFTMDALRQDKDSILTLLNVLRYDPLYTWTLSPLRAKKMQDAQVLSRDGVEEASSKKKEHEAGEADRALSIVEKKLSQTLSTAATVNELIQQATDETNLATLFSGWAAFY